MDSKLQLDVMHNKLLQQTETSYLWMSRHRLWSCFASQRDPEPFRQAMSLRSRGYTTNKKSIGWLFFGRREDVQERRYNYSTYSDIPIKYPAFSPFPLRHLVTSRHNQWWRHSLAHVVVDWDILSEEKTFTTEKYGAMPPPPPQKRSVCLLKVYYSSLPPSLFWCLCITNENVGESKLPFLKKSENNDIFGKQFNYSPFLKEITFNNPLTFWT